MQAARWTFESLDCTWSSCQAVTETDFREASTYCEPAAASLGSAGQPSLSIPCGLWMLLPSTGCLCFSLPPSTSLFLSACVLCQLTISNTSSLGSLTLLGNWQFQKSLLCPQKAQKEDTELCRTRSGNVIMVVSPTHTHVPLQKKACYPSCWDCWRTL